MGRRLAMSSLAGVLAGGLMLGALPGLAAEPSFVAATSPRTAAPDYDAFSWGSNGNGQLGLGSNTVPIDVATALLPGANTTGAWESVTAGYTTACGIDLDGRAYCWGDNRYGALGNGTTSTSGDDSVPVAVSGNLSWTALSAGGYYSGPFHNHVCGVAANGDAYCWGYNGTGQLGNGTQTDDSVPHLVNGGLTWTSVTAGGQHTCGITVAGAAYCWGLNNYGQLGNGSQTDDSAPVAVVGGHQWKALSAGLNWTCGITQSNQAYCWGYNGDGQLGNGSQTNGSAPVSVTPNVNTSGGWSAIDGGYGSTCAIGLDSAAYCWGRNTYGQLGDDTTVDSYLPVRTLLPLGEPVTSVGVGTDSEFACATTATNVYCWGDNGNGTLGNPSAVNPSLTPVATSPTWQSATTVPKAISVGGSFSILLTGVPDSPTPSPTPALPPSAPREITAAAGDGSASVSWSAPASSGSFPVSHYLATSSPGGRTCLVAAPALTCEVTGLTNGTAYTFTVKALNGAGWSASSDPSDSVVPRPSAGPSIVITGTREGKRIEVTGSTTGFGMGGILNPWVRLAGQSAYSEGSAQVLVSMDGTFEWSRTTGKKASLYMQTPDGSVKSNTVAIPAR